METVRASRNASAELSFAPHHVGNGFIRSMCNDFACIHQSGNRKNVSVQIGCASKKGRAMLAPTIIDFSADKVGTCGTGKSVPLLEVFRSLP